MAHGGGGGGGGFGGHGGGYGGHGGGYGGHVPHAPHVGGHQSQGVVAGHHGLSITHALGLAQHHTGNAVGGVLHALGLGHNGAQHHLSNGGQPDQSPTWNQAMQGERGLGQYLRIDKRPFIVLFLLVSVSFGWLWIVYNIHHGEGAKYHPDAADSPGQLQTSVGQFAPSPPDNQGQAPYSAQAYGQTQAAAVQNYAAQYMQSATAVGAQSAFGSATPGAAAGYGYGAGTPAMTGGSYSGGPSAASSGYGGFGTPGATSQAAYGSYGAGQGTAGQGSMLSGAFRLGGPAVYAPVGNGRARLMVNR